jgi:hypothetical protein
MHSGSHHHCHSRVRLCRDRQAETSAYRPGHHCPSIDGTGIDTAMTAPVNLPQWATIPKTVFPNGSVEVGGVMYVQVSADRPHQASDPCYWCVAYNNMALCDVICCACNQGFVFAKQMSAKGNRMGGDAHASARRKKIN